MFWYDAYNACKHDKVKNLKDAKLFNVLNAFSALFIVYTAQFGTEDFATGYEQFLLQGGYYDGNFGIGQYLMYKFSADWLEEEKYDICTDTINESIFQKYNYDALKGVSND